MYISVGNYVNIRGCLMNIGVIICLFVKKVERIYKVVLSLVVKVKSSLICFFRKYSFLGGRVEEFSV